jgi:hypothetical protein
MVHFLGAPLGGRIVLHALKWQNLHHFFICQRPLAASLKVFNGAAQRSIHFVCPHVNSALPHPQGQDGSGAPGEELFRVGPDPPAAWGDGALALALPQTRGHDQRNAHASLQERAVDNVSEYTNIQGAA